MVAKILFVPIAAVVFSAPHQRAVAPVIDQEEQQFRMKFSITDGEVHEFIISEDRMMQDLLDMQRELEVMREQAIHEALEELKELDAQMDELETERTLILDRIQRIKETAPAPSAKVTPVPSATRRPSPAL